MRRGSQIQRSLKPRDQPIDLGLGRPRHSLRRHHSPAQLAHNLFECLGVLRRVVDVHLVEHQAANLGFFVVAGDAILINQGVLGRGLGAQHRCSK